MVFAVQIHPDYCFSNLAGTTPAGDGDPILAYRSLGTNDIVFICGSGANAMIMTDAGGGKWYAECVDPQVLAAPDPADLSASFPTAATVGYSYWIDTVVAPARCSIGTTGNSTDAHWDRFDGFSYVALLRTTRLDAQPLIPLGNVVQVVRSDATDFSRRVNGTADITTTAAYGAAGVNNWRVGYNNVVNGDVHGRVYGWAAFDSVLDTTATENLETWLAGLR